MQIIFLIKLKVTGKNRFDKIASFHKTVKAISKFQFHNLQEFYEVKYGNRH